MDREEGIWLEDGKNMQETRRRHLVEVGTWRGERVVSGQLLVLIKWSLVVATHCPRVLARHYDLCAANNNARVRT